MKKLHITTSVIALAAAVCAMVFTDTNDAGWLCALSLAVAAALQALFVGREGRCALLKLSVPIAGFALLLAQCGLCAGALLTDSHIFLPLCACVLILLVLSLVRKKQRTAQDDDSDYDITWFPRMLTEMMDTISRATAERSCGIDTQLLYERARFCEPCESPSARLLEKEILSAITEMHPDDSDEVISEKCRAVLKLLDERSKITGVTAK